MDKTNIDFSQIAERYERYSSVQKSAAEILLRLLEIKDTDDVLDLGCGSGNLTRKIRTMTNAKVVGIDPSDGMIREAREKSKGIDITFEVRHAEDINYKEWFDVLFSNSAFQWFRDQRKVIERCYAALRRNGRIGIQTPAGKIYSPNFVEAVEKVIQDTKTKDIFARFNSPWFFMETTDEYKHLFEDKGFRVVFSRIERIKTQYTPAEVFRIFSSGAIAGYLNQDCYDIKIDEEYRERFKQIIRDTFVRQAGSDGKVELVFNRLFLVAVKADR